MLFRPSLLDLLSFFILLTSLCLSQRAEKAGLCANIDNLGDNNDVRTKPYTIKAKAYRAPERSDLFSFRVEVFDSDNLSVGHHEEIMTDSFGPKNCWMDEDGRPALYVSSDTGSFQYGIIARVCKENQDNQIEAGIGKRSGFNFVGVPRICSLTSLCKRVDIR